MVFQPRSGIGDMIWHLPFIRAIARESEGGRVTLYTKSKAFAKDWLFNEPSIDEINYLDRRSMVATALKLRSEGFQCAWTMHDSFSYAMVPFLARIPKRMGLGFGKQRFLLTHEGLPLHLKSEMHIEQMHALLARYGLKCSEEDQKLHLVPQALESVKKQFGKYPKPWIVFGIGASEPVRKWPPTFFTQLGAALSVPGKNTIFVCGSKGESLEVSEIVEGISSKGKEAVGVSTLPLTQTFALLSGAAFFVGNDSSLLNASACLDVPTFGLFGVSPPLTYSKNIHPLIPSKATIPSMEAISPEQVKSAVSQKKLMTS